MKNISTILESIGNTPIVQLNKIVPPGSARILAKLEWANPSGSMKDRMAKAMIESAEVDGRLRAGGTVVEYTGGSTGTSLALVCAAKGYRICLVTSDAFSQEKHDHMRALGAELIVVPSEGGHITKKLVETMIETARRISAEQGAFWTDQLHNNDAIGGYHPLGEEIWAQTDGQVDAFVQVVGTAQSLHGPTAVLRRYNPNLRAVAVEPAESPILSGGKPGAHGIEGIGIGFPPPLWNPELVDDIMVVSTEEAKAMAQRLAREEALFAGTSSGANAVAALRVAELLGPEATVVTLMIDAGLKYLSTDLYKST